MAIHDVSEGLDRHWPAAGATRIPYWAYSDYHASLMHVFLVTFGLFRADQKSAVQMDAQGRHACLISMKGEQKTTAATAEIKNLRQDLQLYDTRLLDLVREYPGEA